MTADAPATLCAICGLEESDARLLARCFDCGSTFHLNPRNDVAGIDCGDAWVGESLGITTYCSNCIARMQEEALAAESADAELARGRGLMQALTPGAAPAPSAAQASPSRVRDASQEALPPRSTRSAAGRRYRRIDR